MYGNPTLKIEYAVPELLKDIDFFDILNRI